VYTYKSYQQVYLHTPSVREVIVKRISTMEDQVAWLVSRLESCSEKTYNANAAVEVLHKLRSGYYNPFVPCENEAEGKSPMPKLELISDLLTIGAVSLSEQLSKTREHDALFQPSREFMQQLTAASSEVCAMPACLLDGTFAERVFTTPEEGFFASPEDADNDNDSDQASDESAQQSVANTSAETVFVMDEQQQRQQQATVTSIVMETIQS
jgi:hypothetical protein